MCTKVSICFFLLRIPQTASRKLSIPLWVGIVVLLVSNTVLTLLWVFQCRPIKAAWEFHIENAKCFGHDTILQMILAQALISIISDFALSFFPIVFLYKLNMGLKQKVGIAILMGLGCITGACSIVRTVLNGQSVAPDATYGGITNWFWRLFEVDLGLICACVPTLVPLWKWMTKKVSNSYFVSRMKSYTPRVSISKGRPSISKPSKQYGSAGRPSKGSLGNLAVPDDRNGWSENVGKPKKAMLASRTERAIMGRAGNYDDMTTLKTEMPPDVEPGTSTTAAGAKFPQTDEEREAAAADWESSLRMPWMKDGRTEPNPRTIGFAPDIEIARNTSLTVTLEDAKRSGKGHQPKGSTSRYPLVNHDSMTNTTDASYEMENLPNQTEPERRTGGVWNRVVTAVSGGQRNSGGNWKKMDG